jgi:hypothetical protein
MLRVFRQFRATLVLTLVLVCACGAWSASALAGPGWMLTANTYPTALAPGGTGQIVVNVMNIGANASSGTVTVTDTLPAGVVAEEAAAINSFLLSGQTEVAPSFWDCTGNGGGPVRGATVVTCTNDPGNLPSIAGGGGNPGAAKGPDPVPPVWIKVKLPQGEISETNHAVIAGGGAPTAVSTSDPITVTARPAPFGFEGWRVWASNADGTLDTQAGSHPYEVSFSFDLNRYLDGTFGQGWTGAGAQPGRTPLAVRNIEARLPPGFVGNPNIVPGCTRQQLDEGGECSAASQIGIVTVRAISGKLLSFPVYNMVAPGGFPDELGFIFSSGEEGVETLLDTGVRSGGDYGLVTRINDVPERSLIESTLTLWGVPGDPSHDIWRRRKGGACSPEELGTSECPKVGGGGKPFLTLPTSCGASPEFSIRANTWQDANITAEASGQLLDANEVPTGFTGCSHLSFAPTITTNPDTAKADTPAGLTVEVRPPLAGLENTEGLGSADIQNTTVTLPEGVVVNPGQAAGLQTCGPEEDGLTTDAEKAAGSEDNGPAHCPDASKIGTVTIQSPLIEASREKEFLGNVYLLRSTPPELKLLVAASADGVNLKLVGTVHLDEQTGRLTTTFEGTPELPFSVFKLSFSGGAQAALATPTHCGVYTSYADFMPWSTPFVADFATSASFQIDQGTNGAPCPPSVLPFGPTLTAGSTTDQAGGFTDFSLLLQAPDDQQRIGRLQFKTPEGLLGMISKVPLCTNAQAEANACPGASQIGHTVVASGPGPYPLVIPQPGQAPAPIYLTEGYEGAPYGLSIVVPLNVGPFVLPTQRVRAKIEVDSLTSQLTVTTDPLPQVVSGVPTDLRSINAVIDKPGFMFNPTSCDPMSFSGTAYSAQGASTPISSPFQMGSCRSLLFKPNFKVSTSGKTSRKNGASLDAKIVYPRGPLGANQASSQSNLKSVKVDLPKQLPSRLTTLQKACTSQVFEANPASCPTDSRVGTASAITPVLPVELTGPAYFVSYGSAKFPELVLALQGYGVTIYVHGETFINKAGITSSTFHKVPDVPIYQFELKLPQGPFSALAANGNLCNTKLKMPTSFTAQDGAVIHQTTPISVTGCVKHKAKKKTKAKHKQGKKGK